MKSTTTQANEASSSSSSSIGEEGKQGPHGAGKRTRLMRIIGRSLLGLMVLVGLAIVICWLLVFPKTPIFTLERGQVTPHSLTDRKLNASIAFTIKSYNPNKRATIHIDYMTMTVDEMGQKFRTSIPTFSQPPQNQTFLTPSVEINFIYPFGRLIHRVQSDGFNPELRFSAEISYILERWESKHRSVKIYCNRVRLKVNGSTPFDNSKCTVDL